jgi:CRP/FNR family transcriptional regulator, cyclic AMP receptor protein
MSEWLPLEEVQRLLVGVAILEPLPPGEVRPLASDAALRRLGAGEDMLVTPQMHAQRTALLLEGRVRVYEDGPPDRAVTASVAEVGTVVGVTGLAACPQALHVEALVPSVLCLVGREAFEGLVVRNPQVGLRLVHLLAERVVVLERRLTDLAYKDVPARLASQLLRLVESEGVVTPEGYKIATRYTHQQLATMIGTKREATTRAMRALRECGAIEVRRRRIHVVDQEALARAAEDG